MSTVNQTYWLLLTPIFWLIATGCLRKIQVTYAHHAVHNCLFLSKNIINSLSLYLFTVIPIVQNGKDYKVDHLNHHDGVLFTTKHDSDAAFLRKIGFVSGLSVGYYKKLLFKTIFSPRFHLYFIRLRCKSFFIRGSWIESFGACVWFFILLAPFKLHPVYATIFIFVPYFLLYNISSLLQFLTEHAWLKTIDAPSNSQEYAQRCWGRFLGEKYPIGQNTYSKIKWWFRMIFIHAPCRVAILCGDLPVHDWHHLAGEVGQSSIFWQKSIYLREDAIKGQGKHLAERELWGLRDMIENSFHSLSHGRG